MNDIKLTIPDYSLDEMERIAKIIAESGLFGITKPAQATALMLICKSEGLDPIAAMKRYHIIENRPSMRADAMQGEFLARGGGIIFHIRTDEIVAGTFFVTRAAIDDEARTRSAKRFEIMWTLESEPDPAKRSRAMQELGRLGRDGEETIVRTYADCEAKGLTLGKGGTKTNWATSPRQMLTARVITEGVRIINPGLIAGVYTPDELSDAEPTRQIENKPSGPSSRDKEAMKAIVEQHQQEALETTNPERRRELLGLASDLKHQIDEPDEIPMVHATDVTLSHSASEPPPQSTSGGELHETFSVGEDLPLIPVVTPPTTWRDYHIQHIKAKSYAGKKLGDLTKEEIAMLFEKKALPNLNSDDHGLKTEARWIELAQMEVNP